MNNRDFKQQIPTTPAFVLDEDQVLANLSRLLDLREAAGCKILYSIKALPLASLLELIKTQIDGVSASSLFEARLAKEVLGEEGSLHVTTPGLRPAEFDQLSPLCSHISFNSLSQHQALQGRPGRYSKGLRINPKLSFVADKRYDPCRHHSKLGTAIELLQAGLPEDIAGLHFHTVFGCGNFAPLLETVAAVIPLLKRYSQLKWLNMGGGYLYDSIADQKALIDVIKRLRTEFGINVYIEPGKAVVNNAGFLVTTVLDRFISDGKTILILDTSVNHLPEVFEYQLKPQLLEEQHDFDEGQTAILAGSTCLAGDLFGEYRFARLPEVSERLIFSDAAAYSLVKASRFNGYNLPDIYRLKEGCLYFDKRYAYEDYRRQWRS